LNIGFELEIVFEFEISTSQFFILTMQFILLNCCWGGFINKLFLKLSFSCFHFLFFQFVFIKQKAFSVRVGGNLKRIDVFWSFLQNLKLIFILNQLLKIKLTFRLRFCFIECLVVTIEFVYLLHQITHNGMTIRN